MADHLQTLAGLPKVKQEEYIEELLHSRSICQTLDFCGDHTINALLTVKENLMEQKGIFFEYQFDITQELTFDKVDVCAIFANLLDNAIEACDKLPQKQRSSRTLWRTF